MMHRLFIALTFGTLALTALNPRASAQDRSDKARIKQSNVYTNTLLDIQLAHSPEQGSQEGITKFDDRISNPTLADDLAQRRELVAALAKIKTAEPTVTDKNVHEDIEILQKAFNLQFRTEDYELAHEVPFINASSLMFQGLRVLLD